MNRGAPGWLFGTLRGVPIYIGRSWPVVAIAIVLTFGPIVRSTYPDLGAQAYVVAVLYALLLLLSVLVHEAAHALVGQWRGYRVRHIVADLLGGHTSYDSQDTTPLSSALVAVVGPLANAVLAGGGWLLLQTMHQDVPRLLLGAFVYSNAFVAAFNLLPGMPLDGGFLVDALVWRLTGSRHTGLIVAGWCGRVVAVLVVAGAVVLPLMRGDQPGTFSVLWSVLIAGFLWMGAGNAIARGTTGRLFARVRIRDVLRPCAVAGHATPVADLPVGVDVVALDVAGRPWGVVTAQALAQVPVPTSAAVTTTSVAVLQPDGWVVTVDSLEDDVTELVRATHEAGAGVTDLFVVHADQPAGLVSVAVLGRTLAAAEGATGQTTRAT